MTLLIETSLIFLLIFTPLALGTVQPWSIFIMRLTQEPTTSNQEPATNNQQPRTNNQEPTTSNQEPATSNRPTN